MEFAVRKYRFWRDLPFVLHILRGEETRRKMFDNRRAYRRFCFFGRYENEYLCTMISDGKKTKMAVAKFCLDKENEYWISGALNDRYYNSGYGVYSCVAFINEFFKTHPSSVVCSGAFVENKASFKMTSRIGFEPFRMDDKVRQGVLTQERFNNDFVNYIKQKYNIK